MTSKIKIAAVALAAATLIAGAADAKPFGHHHHGHWGGWGLGAVGLGIATGAYLASQPVVYVDGPRCRWVRQFDNWGNYVGRAKVCRY